MRQSDCIETLAIWGTVIITTTADRRKSGSSIHIDGRIAITNFEMHANDPIVSCPFNEMPEQLPSDTAAVVRRRDGKQEQLGLVGDGAKQRETDRILGFDISGKKERNAAHRQDSSKLGAGPCFA